MHVARAHAAAVGDDAHEARGHVARLVVGVQEPDVGTHGGCGGVGRSGGDGRGLGGRKGRESEMEGRGHEMDGKTALVNA